MVRGPQSLLTVPLPILFAPLQGCPASVELEQNRFTPFHWGWLKVLKVSQRNCKVEDSWPNQGSWKFLIRLRSQLLRPGPVMANFPMYPNMPGSPFEYSWGTVICPIVEGSNQLGTGPNSGEMYVPLCT